MSTHSSKESIVFVHGYLGGSLQWQQQVSFLSKRFNVITLDLPGYGLNNTATAPESIAGFAADVLSQLDTLKIERFHLVGHSMGGMIAQEVISQAPQRVDKLILYGTGASGVMPGRFETIEASKQRLMDEGVDSTARRIAAKWFVQGSTSSAYQDCADIAIQASPQAALAGLSAMQDWSGVAYLANIQSPTLVVWGDCDQSYPWTQPEKLWRDIADANLSVIAQCSHAVHLEKPDLFNAVLDDFLRKL